MNFFKKLYNTARTPSTHSLDALKATREAESDRSSLESSPSENFLCLKYAQFDKRNEGSPTDHGCSTPSRRPSMCLSYATVVHSVHKSKPSQTEKTEKVLAVREVKLSSNKHIAEVLHGLYLGSKDAAHDLNVLKQFNISHILNVTEEVEVKHSDKLVKTLQIPLKDMPSTNILMHFQVAFDFIDEARFGAQCGFNTSSPKRSGKYKSRQGIRLDGSPAKDNGILDSNKGEESRFSSTPVGPEDHKDNSPKKGKKLARAESTRKPCGSVLVHCYYGVSRSAAIVLGYLMERENMSLDDSLKYLRIIRPQVKPNDGFLKQLKRFEEGLFPKGCKKN